MNIYDRIKKMTDTPLSYDQKMYNVLTQSANYRTNTYSHESLGEEMGVVNQVINGWWKPRFLVNHRLHTAYEWMWPNQQLAIVDSIHIDWESMGKLPDEALSTLRDYSFRYPSFIRDYHNGIAIVEWQLIPDGRYWMDDDGYGMTGDTELNIYGFIDREANIVGQFRYIAEEELRRGVLEEIRLSLSGL